MEHRAPPARKIGRPRASDRDAALLAAMRALRAHGYEATSTTNLTAAMGINAPAIYSAFGNKEGLFRKALQLCHGDPQVQALAIRA